MSGRVSMVVTSAVVVGALGLTACSAATSTGGAPAAAGSAGSSAAAYTPATTATELAPRMRAALARTKSLRGSLTVTSAMLTEAGSFTEVITDGTASAMDLVLQLKASGSSQLIKMRLVGKDLYLGGPLFATTGKTWVKASTSSSNPAVAAAAKSVGSALASASLDQYVLFVKATRSLADKGSETVNGARAEHYALDFDPALAASQLSGDQAKAMQALVSAGVTSIPLDVWVDTSDRPVRIAEKITVASQTISTDITVAGYDVPVTIAAPAAADVSSG